MNSSKLALSLCASLAASALFLGCAHVAVQGDSSTTPLMWAAQAGDLGKVRDLVANGADVNARNANGVSVLYHTVYYKHAEVARYLMSRGAAPSNENERRDINLMLGISPDALPTNAPASAPSNQTNAPSQAALPSKQWWEH